MKISILTSSRIKDQPLQHVVALVKLAGSFHSTILLKCNDEIADLRHSSVITIVALCVMANALELEVIGIDEQDAARSVQELFFS